MSQPHDHSPSGSDPAAADRFWSEFGRTNPGHDRPRRAAGGNGAPPPLDDPATGPEPPAGADEHAADHECLEWCPICRSADVVRTTLPPDLRDQWQHLQRDALVLIRALVDAYIARVREEDRAREQEAQTPVEDIPIS